MIIHSLILASLIASSGFAEVKESHHPAVLRKHIDIGYGRFIYKLDFDGHEYLVYSCIATGEGDNFIHNPDCKCLQKKQD